jgi:DMSO/TMAO reductase YedYZ heme-binding membrane subunit
MKTVFLRHLLVGSLSVLMIYLFYLSYGAWGVEPALWPAWDQDHPLWRAFAHAAFVLLFLSLAVGPAARLWGPMARLISWRREFGIWFVVMSIGHGYVIWDRWARWDVATLFGFQYVPEVGSYILARPEVGIMNLMGLVVLPMIILLALTSSDWATELLGPSWKWLHSSLVHVIFYVLMLRGILYFFFFFQFSPPNWRFYPPIWFLYVFLGMGVVLVVLQAAAFAKTALRRLDRAERRSVVRVGAIIGMAALFVLPMALATGTVAYFDSRVLKQPPPLSGNPAPPARTGDAARFSYFRESPEVTVTTMSGVAAARREFAQD